MGVPILCTITPFTCKHRRVPESHLAEVTTLKKWNEG